MDIRQILALEANTTSIKKIDEFLSGINPSHRDYPRALSHLAYLTFLLGDTSSSFQLLFNYLNVCIDKEKPTIYNTLIKIYYIQKDYDNVYNMILAKKDYLPNYNKVAYYEDLIIYYEETNNNSELIRTILTYLGDDITDEKRLNALIKLCDLYLANEEYDHFNEKNKLVESLALSLNEEVIYQNALYNEAYVLVKECSYPKALNMIDEMLETHLSKELKGKLLTLKLEILIALNDYRKASIFEAEYEMDVEASTLDARIQFAKECIKLYEILNNRFNKTTYEEKLAALLEEESKQTTDVKKVKTKKQPKHTIELNFLKNQTPQTYSNNKPFEYNSSKYYSSNVMHQQPEKVLHMDHATMIESGSKLSEISEVFMKLNNEVFSQFRDYLRNYFMVLNKITTFTEAYFLTKTNDYYGYHYKKERLYEKKSNNVNPNDTPLLDAIDIMDEVIVSDTVQTTYLNIITNKLYKDEENKSLIIFPVANGAVLFSHNNQDILTDKLNYETLKLAIAYLELKWNNEQNELYLLKKNHDYAFMMENIVVGYKRQIDNYVYLSQKACEMFNLPEAISIDRFYLVINSNDLINYRKTISDLLNKKTDKATIRYRSQVNGKTLYFEEVFMVDSDDTILSVINDITQKVVEEEDSLKLAHTDPISGTYNKSKLVYDMASLVEMNKFSLLILNVIGFKNYSEIYGYEFTEQLIFAIGKYLKEYDNDNGIYHFDGDKYIVSVIGLNDKRTMINYSKKLTNYLSEKLKKLNYRLNIEFEVGILRYPTDTIETNPHKLIDYLLSALTSAHHNNLSNISCYSKEDFKEQFFQTQLITHISESIDSNHLALYYRQVVDAGQNICDHYYVSLNLSNFSVDDEVIYEVLKRRNMTKMVERYMIHKALFELEEMYKEVKLYFNISLKVSRETLIDETFKDYLLEQLKFFNIPKNAVTICYNDEVDDKVYETLKSLVLNQILISSSNVEVLKQFPLYYYYYKLPKEVKNIENEFISMMKNHCEKRNIKIVLDNVNNKNLIAHFAQMGISLYSGKIYNALLSSKDIIKSFLV